MNPSNAAALRILLNLSHQEPLPVGLVGKVKQIEGVVKRAGGEGALSVEMLALLVVEQGDTTDER